MPLWIPITVTAALFQCWRTAMQQKLRHLLSINGAGFVRFLYGAPTAMVLLGGALAATRLPVPVPTPVFLVCCAAGGLTQIIGTNLLIMAFGYRNFAVGTAYAKTEAAQSGLIALIVLHEVLRPLAWAGIALGLAGVMMLSLNGRGMRPATRPIGALLAATLQPAALCGLGAGFLFAVSTVFVKLATQALVGPSLFVRALFVLAVTNTMQTLMQGAWLAWREPEQLRKAVTTWRSSALVGTLSACGSACWFTAFALTDVALVRSVGQVEIVFTLLFSRFYLRETLRPGDAAGLALVVGGVLLIVLGR